MVSFLSQLKHHFRVDVKMDDYRAINFKSLLTRAVSTIDNTDRENQVKLNTTYANKYCSAINTNAVFEG